MKSILYIVNKSPSFFRSEGLDTTLIGIDDSVLFIEDGVYHAMTSPHDQVFLSEMTARCYVLEPDMLARGLPEERLHKNLTYIDYDGFVDLTVAHELSVNL